MFRYWPAVTIVIAVALANGVVVASPVTGDVGKQEQQQIVQQASEPVAVVQPQAVEDKAKRDQVKDDVPVKDQQPNREARNFDNEIKAKPLSVGQNEATLINKLNAKCSQREVTSCVMLKLVSYMNRLLKKSSIDVSESLVITQTSAVVEEESPLSRSISEDGSEESQLGQLIADKLWSFVRSRSLKWKIFPEADLVVSTTPDDKGTLNLGMTIRAGKALETGRGKMKNMGPLLAAGMMKAGMMGVLAFKALALLVGKALLVSKLAFLLAAIIGLKKLFSTDRHVTYEVVAHPHHSHSHVGSHISEGHHGGDSYSSGWGRSIDVAPASAAVLGKDAHELAYKAHAA